MKILWTVTACVAALCLPVLAAGGEAQKAEVAKGETAKGETAKGEVGKGTATKGEVAKADAQRKKPLQRCDQLKGDAELECLKKARERVVEARKKRESTAKADESKLKDKPVEKDTSPQKK